MAGNETAFTDSQSNMAFFFIWPESLFPDQSLVKGTMTLGTRLAGYTHKHNKHAKTRSHSVKAKRGTYDQNASAPVHLWMSLVTTHRYTYESEKFRGKWKAILCVTEEREKHTQCILPFDTLIRKIGFCPERDSNPRLPEVKCTGCASLSLRLRIAIL